MNLYAVLVFSHLFAHSFAYQGAIDPTNKPLLRFYYPGTPASYASKRIVTIPRKTLPVSSSPYKSSGETRSFHPETQVLYIGISPVDGSPVLSIQPVQQASSSSYPSNKVDTDTPPSSGRASSDLHLDNNPSGPKYSDIFILRNLLTLIRILQRQAEQEERSANRVHQYPKLNHQIPSN